MKLIRIRLVVGLMILSLSGLIVIQVYWITKALEVNRESFARRVNEALQNVTQKLERRDAFAFISKKSFKDTAIIPDIGVKALTPNALKPYLLSDLHKRGYPNFFLDATDPSGSVNADYQSMMNYYHDGPQADTMPGPGEMPDSTVIADAEDLDHISAPEAVNKILKKKYLLQKLAVDLARRNDPVGQRCNPAQVDTMLARELGNQGIDIPYQYGIYEERPGKWVYATANPDLKALKASSFKAQLFPNDFFLEPNYLKVYFPGQHLYILKQVSTIMASSLIFIIIIGFTFVWMMRSFLQQKKLSDMKTDFINNMTHEFKTPITTIALASEALKDPEVKKDENRLGRYAGLISEENKKLESQVERVLQIARIEREEQRLSIERLDMHALILEDIQHTNLMMEERSGAMHTSFAARRHYINGDPVHMHSIMNNLIDNAIKYSDGAPDITVKTYNQGPDLVIEVADNGIGMAGDQLKKVFDKFYRVPTGNVHNVKGFGLGLSYVKTMVEAHGGTISVKSAPGRGSTFTITLPALEL